jgi:iron complex transport system ATP-binding protein
VFFEKSFDPISEAVFQNALDRMNSCNIVINCLKTYGEINMKNKTLYREAVSQGKKILESADML